MKRRSYIYLARLAVLVAILAAWQYLPSVHWLSSRYRFLDPFFVSSPEQVSKRTWDLATADHGAISIWPYLWSTLWAAFIGFAIGMAIGFLIGLLLSNAPTLDSVLSVFIAAANSVPRIAIIPIIIVMVGPGATASVISVVVVVFFVTFFNAYEGGRNVPRPVLNNARVMQARAMMTMLHVRLPYVLQWTFAVLPNAVAFSLLIVVTSQILQGTGGIGALMLTAQNSLDTTTTMALVVYLSATGVLALRIAELAKRRLLHWTDS